jgi:hypothetical protein
MTNWDVFLPFRGTKLVAVNIRPARERIAAFDNARSFLRG